MENDEMTVSIQLKAAVWSYESMQNIRRHLSTHDAFLALWDIQEAIARFRNDEYHKGGEQLAQEIQDAINSRDLEPLI